MVRISEIEERVEKVWRDKVCKDILEWFDPENESELQGSLYYWLKHEFRKDQSIWISLEREIPWLGIVDVVLFKNKKPLFFFEVKCHSENLGKARFREDLEKLEKLSKSGCRGYIVWASPWNYADEEDQPWISGNLIKILEDSNKGFFRNNLKWRQGFFREAIGVRGGKRKHWRIRYFEGSKIYVNKYTS